jgi:cytidine deaminase
MDNKIKDKLAEIAEDAWKVRENAYIIGKTKVGAAALSSNGKVYLGCNVEHKFRSHDVHAETNAITNMVAQGETELSAIIIVAERERFTPCGSCMDWIYQFGGDSCIVAYQTAPEGEIKFHRADELMPFYPK